MKGRPTMMDDGLLLLVSSAGAGGSGGGREGRLAGGWCCWVKIRAGAREAGGAGRGGRPAMYVW